MHLSNEESGVLGTLYGMWIVLIACAGCIAGVVVESEYLSEVALARMRGRLPHAQVELSPSVVIRIYNKVEYLEMTTCTRKQ